MGEHRWILALMGRCLSYAFLLGAYFFGLGLMLLIMGWGLLSIGLAMRPSLSVLSFFISGSDQFVLSALMVLMGVLVEATVIGSIGGAIAGFHSPPREVGSVYLDPIIKHGSFGLGGGVLAGVFCGLALGTILGGMVAFGTVFILVFAGQGFGMWRGINLAIRQERERVAVDSLR